MADTAHENAKTLGSAHLYYGASLYRLGRSKEALEVLAEYAESLDQGGDVYSRHLLACTKYVQSPARNELGHKAQSRRLLEEANDTFDSLPESFLRFHRQWRLDLEVLRDEATSALAE